MTQLHESIQSIPWSQLSGAGFLILIGVILWAGGRRTLKPGLAATGFLIGATLGSIFGGIIDFGVPWWATGLIAGLMAAVIALIFFRIATIVALAAILGLTAPLLVRSVGPGSWYNPAPDSALAPDDPSLSDRATEMLGEINDEITAWAWLENAERIQSLTEIEIPLVPGDQTPAQIPASGSLAEWTWGLARDTWTTAPEQRQASMLVAAMAGVLFAILLGVIAPRCSATIVTAFGGALFWLYGVRIILLRLGLDHLPLLPESATLWMILWVIVSLIGIQVQKIFRSDPSEPSLQP